MAVTPKYDNGRLVGYFCKLSHTHGSSAEAEECEKDPSQYTAAEREAKTAKEKQRVLDIRNSDAFEEAIDAVRELGAADDDDADEVVIANGINKVLAARDAVRALKIPSPKKDPKGDPKGKNQGNAGPVPPKV